MTEKLYKATSTTPLDPRLVKLLTGTPMMVRSPKGSPAPIPAMLMSQYAEEYILREFHACAISTGRTWFIEHDRDERHWLNTYCRTTDDKTAAITTWVFSDADTALLFKLSLA